MEDEINNSSIIRDMENIVNTDINLSDEEVEYRDEWKVGGIVWG